MISLEKLTWLKNLNDCIFIGKNICGLEDFTVAAAAQLRDELVVILVIKSYLRVLVVTIVGVVNLKLLDSVSVETWQVFLPDSDFGYFCIGLDGLSCLKNAVHRRHFT